MSEEANQMQIYQMLNKNDQKNTREMIATDYIQSNLRYPIQVELKKQFQGIPSTQELLKDDIKIMKQFNKLV